MRAATLDEAVVARLLRTIAEEPLQIVATIVNKQVILFYQLTKERIVVEEVIEYYLRQDVERKKRLTLDSDFGLFPRTFTGS